MISRKLLWFIGLAFAGLLIITWWAGSYPARLVIINQGAALRDVVLHAGDEEIVIGEIARGGTAKTQIPSGHTVELRYTAATEERTWRSIEPVAPAQAIVLYVRPNERIEVRGATGQSR